MLELFNLIFNLRRCGGIILTEQKTTDAQKRATQAYRERNREKTRKQSAKSAAKTFINKYSNLDELKELKLLIDKREKELSE